MQYSCTLSLWIHVAYHHAGYLEQRCGKYPHTTETIWITKNNGNDWLRCAWEPNLSLSSRYGWGLHKTREHNLWGDMEPSILHLYIPTLLRGLSRWIRLFKKEEGGRGEMNSILLRLEHYTEKICRNYNKYLGGWWKFVFEALRWLFSVWHIAPRNTCQKTLNGNHIIVRNSVGWNGILFRRA